MEALRATGFVNMGSALTMNYTPVDVLPHSPKLVDIDFDSTVTQCMADSYLVSLRFVQDNCETLGLQVTLLKVKRIITQLESLGISVQDFADASKDILERLRDELDSKLFLHINEDHVHYYNDPLHGWESAIDRFPSMGFDVEEAAKCLALNRYTACVFHLGRIAEIGVVAVANRVGYQSPRPGFGEVLNYMDQNLTKVREKYTEASPLFKGSVEFLAETTAHMHSVNQAWRQNVAHMDKKYTEEEAERTFLAIKALMQHLATQLEEVLPSC